MHSLVSKKTYLLTYYIVLFIIYLLLHASCVVRAVFTTLVGIAVPFFGGLLGFFGGFAFAPTTYYVRDP